MKDKLIIINCSIGLSDGIYMNVKRGQILILRSELQKGIKGIEVTEI